jgi:hypothetical protein
VESHVCNEALSGRSRLHALDIQDIGALIASSSMYSEGPFTLFRLKDDEAQLMLDLLQTVRQAHQVLPSSADTLVATRDEVGSIRRVVQTSVLGCYHPTLEEIRPFPSESAASIHRQPGTNQLPW